ncbi:MAG: DUF4355 domain-containing protein [Paenibacillus dendritiformis]|uniref:DUF4355 domain-containing protein n=1 Tax=uncultured Paenibacillus sp. TaxID=227322 RepID=UPI0025F26B52|nr:DUF4355 domain-containing protein [uncultured Paenibacillus sp.]MDU5141072.1 DUF4355 domain-containing protein [Paenibacillus dendritiformis]
MFRFGRQWMPRMGVDEGAGSAGSASAGEEKTESAPLSEEEIARQIEAAKEAARAEAKAEYEQQLAEKLEQTKTEAAKLAKMTADEKAAYEREQREAELTRREAAIAERELRAETGKILADKGLPAGVLDIVIGKDAADTAARIDAFKAAYDKAVQAGVEARLQGKTPVTGNQVAQADTDAARDAFTKALQGGFN